MLEPFRAISAPWMASQVLAYVSHGQLESAEAATPCTFVLVVFGLLNCAHHRVVSLIIVTVITLCGLLT